MTTILFPSLPHNLAEPDPSFTAETNAARDAGFVTGLIDTEIFTDSVSTTPLPADGKVLYRGWIVSPEKYDQVFKATDGRALVTPKQYRTAYEFPNWYTAVASYTPRSIWLPGTSEALSSYLDGVVDSVKFSFGNSPVVVKDYLKSRKHEWFDACFIRDASDTVEVKRVVSNFLRLQADSFVGGLVFREFVDLQKIGIHPKSQMPLALEYRTFIYNKQMIYTAPYWSTGSYENFNPPSAEFVERRTRDVDASFFTADWVQTTTGDWYLMEINDGGTAGVPEGGDVSLFYKSLFNAITLPNPTFPPPSV